jgi:hypothetical protein
MDSGDAQKHTHGASIRFQDARLTAIMQWVIMITTPIAAAALIATVALMLQMKSDVEVLKSQSSRNAPAIDQLSLKLDTVGMRVTELQIKVGVIEARQAEARNAVR